MLFFYKILPEHSIYQLQRWIDQIFFEVWCKAESNIEYSVELLPSDIREYTLEIYNNDKIKKDYFYGPIESIYKIFQTLDGVTKRLIEQCYRNNNNVEALCRNDTRIRPILYSEVRQINSELGSLLYEFYKELFDGALHLESIKERIGTLHSHYNDFIKLNNSGICPICGLFHIDNEHNSTREAYDHYLPKSKYPFNSINFTNLAPICYKCNSAYKGATDPLHNANNKRRKAFYVYSTDTAQTSVNISITSDDVDKLKPEEVVFSFGPEINAEEIETWKDVFGIESRYKAVCVGSDKKTWLHKVLCECQNYGLTPKDFLEAELKSAAMDLYSERNFLKKPFLEACNEHHIFD